jgi:hypothetical protein
MNDAQSSGLALGVMSAVQDAKHYARVADLTILNAKIVLQVIKAARHDQAADALSRARATMDCWYAPVPFRDCATTSTELGDYAVDHPGREFGDQHEITASLLLDGFSVEEITAVGG